MYIRDLERFALSLLEFLSLKIKKNKSERNARPTPSEVKKWRSISPTFTVFSKPWRHVMLPNLKYRLKKWASVICLLII
jgi:hypothetical protein